MSIHSTAIVEDGAEVGDAQIGPFCRIGAGAKIHDGVILDSHVVVQGATEIGANTRVAPFAVLGGPPQHLGCNGDGTKLIIGTNNIIREHVTMNRGTVAGGGVTRVGDGCMFMTGSHVAHDSHVGDRAIFANNVAIGGHVTIGEQAFLGGLCAIHQHCRVGEHAFIGGCAAVTCDVIPYASAVGNHARLAGLNIIGLKRRGFGRDALRDLRAAYRILFLGEGVFQARVESVREKFPHSPEVKRMLAFIDENKSRPLMSAAREY